MIQYLKNQNDKIVQCDTIENNTWININPPLVHEDFLQLSNSLEIPFDFLTDSLDIDERPRFEEQDNVKLIVMTTPTENTLFKESDAHYITIPICIILTHNQIVTVNSFDNIAIKNILNTMPGHFIEDRNKMVLNIFEKSVRNFLFFLKQINQKRNILEQELYVSSSNEVLLQLMRIQKSLVYFVTALRSNELLMMKLLRTNFLQLTDEEKEILNDLIVDTSQANEMANIYTNILSSTLDAFASIISNNQNQVLKRLTSITIILQLPVLVASIYGMNVPIPYQNSSIAFYIPVFLSVIGAIVVSILFLKNKWA